MESIEKIKKLFPLDWKRVGEFTQKNDAQIKSLGDRFQKLFLLEAYYVGSNGTSPDYRESNPYFTRFNERGLMFLEKDNFVVVNVESDNQYLNEALQIMKPLTDNISHLVNLGGISAPAVRNIIFEDKQDQIAKLQSELAALRFKPDNAIYIPFVTSLAEQKLATQLGMPIWATDYELNILLNSKYFLSKLLENKLNVGFDLVEGITCVGSDQIAAAIHTLFETHDPKYIKRLLVRASVTAAGMGMKVVERDKFLAMGVDERADYVRTISEQINIDLDGGRAVVQLFVENVQHAPTISNVIHPDGQVEHAITLDMILANEHGGIHWAGATWPLNLSPDLLSDMDAQVGNLCELYAALGCRGYIGTDLIIYPDEYIEYMSSHGVKLRKAAITDPNNRIGGSYFFKYYIEKFGVQAAKMREIELNTPITPFALADLLGDLHFDPQRKEKGGVIMYGTGHLETSNKVSLLILGNDPSHILILEKNLNLSLERYLN